MFIAPPTLTLLVEPDDKIAEHTIRLLKQFPDARIQRVKTKVEALVAITSPEIDQVCINGQMWTKAQALPMIRTM